jgi:hypothetical protein
MKQLDIDTLRSLIVYDPETGQFTWKARGVASWDARYAGTLAGRTDGRGYSQIGLMNRNFMAHRMAWAITHGRWPANDIDHIDGNPSNNRISNLREATRSENTQNRTRHTNNKSGYLGVFWNKQCQKWQAQIMAAGKKRYLGLFDDPRDAHAAYLAAKQNFHTFHPVPRSCASA